MARMAIKDNPKLPTNPLPTAPFSADSVGAGVGLSVAATVPVPVVAPVGRAIEIVEVIASDG
jgi:hypothetical protein